MMQQALIAEFDVSRGDLRNLNTLVADSRAGGGWRSGTEVKPLHLVRGVSSRPNATAVR